MNLSQSYTPIKVLYFFYYAAFGIITVFINVYYREIHLTGVQIGWINSLAPLIGIAGGPLWGLVSDRSARPRVIMSIAVIGAMIAMLGISAVRVFVWILPLAAAWNLFNSPLAPMIDSATMTSLSGKTEQYGSVRLWGTVGYICISITAGILLENIGLDWMFYGYLILMLVMLAAVPGLPVKETHLASQLNFNLRGLILQREWLFFTASLIPLWISINGMYTFLGVYLKDMGASASLIGSISAVGAFAELPMMVFSAFFVRRLGMRRMLVIAYAMYTIRFLLYGLIPAPAWALPVTLMHGVSFGLFWVAGVIYTNTLAPDHMKTTSQSLFFAVTNLAGVIGSPLGGYLLDSLGGATLFRIYSALAALGLAILWFGFGKTSRQPG